MRTGAAALAVLSVGCSGSFTATDAPPATTAPGAREASGATGTPSSTSAAAAPAVPSAGCGSSTAGALDIERRTLDVEGTERWYLLSSPPAHDGRTPVPLVFDFHGLAEGAQVHARMSGLGALGADEGFAVVQPEGQGTPVGWNVRPGPGNGDLAFFDAMVRTVEQDLCIDTSRVYATGLSYGAMMTSMLLCTRADVLAAAAPVAGLQPPGSCQPTRRVPILTFHGTADSILLFNGGIDLSGVFGDRDPTTRATVPPPDLDGPGYPDNVRQWAERNGCDATPVDTPVDPDVIHREYRCPLASPVGIYLVVGGGHAWPGSALSAAIERVVGPTTMTIDASKEMWAFFQRHRLG